MCVKHAKNGAYVTSDSDVIGTHTRERLEIEVKWIPLPVTPFLKRHPDMPTVWQRSAASRTRFFREQGLVK